MSKNVICFDYARKKGLYMLFEKSVKKRYCASLFRRADLTDDVKYFTAADFAGLIREEYKFTSHAGYILSGQFYYYENPIRERIVVFEHGMGNGGHRSYLREIEVLARAGYKVFAYDHTGTAESEGKTLGGLAQSLSDLDGCLETLKSDADYSSCKFSVVGHSWGGYSALNILALHPDVAHVVAISGFISVADMHKQILHGFLAFYRKAAYDIEMNANPKYAPFSAADTLLATDSQVLIIASDNDKVVKTKRHYDSLRKKLSKKKNIRFLLVKGRDHNPNYTRNAVLYKRIFMKRLSKMRKSGLLDTVEQKQKFISEFDWWRMTEQDESVWYEILKTLDK